MFVGSSACPPELSAKLWPICTTAAGSQMTPSSTPWTWCISPSYSSSTLAFWSQWPRRSATWNGWPGAARGPRQGPRQRLRGTLWGSVTPAGAASPWWVSPAWWGPPGVWPSWVQDTSTTPSSTSSASSTPHKVCGPPRSSLLNRIWTCLHLDRFFPCQIDSLGAPLMVWMCVFAQVSSFSCGSVCRPRSKGIETWRRDWRPLLWRPHQSISIRPLQGLGPTAISPSRALTLYCTILQSPGGFSSVRLTNHWVFQRFSHRRFEPLIPSADFSWVTHNSA